MKTQVDKKAVQDLLKKVFYTPHGVHDIMEILHRILPLIEQDVDEDTLVRGIVKIELEMDPDQSETRIADDAVFISRCVRELDHHIDKRAVVEAALAEISTIESKAERLKVMQQQVSDIFCKLDDRTKAILEIRAELARVDGEINTDYMNCLDQLGEVSLDVLQGEPDLKPLLEAYGMARTILTQNE